MVNDPVKYKDNVSACSLCYSCQNVCPAKVDLADQIYLWRQKLPQLGVENKTKHLKSRGMDRLLDHGKLFHEALRFAPLANHVPHFMVENALNAWGAEREMPHFAQCTFDDLYNEETKRKEEKRNHVK